MTRPLGDNLATHRRRRGMSQRGLAEAAGVSVDLVRKLEQGQRKAARLDTVAALAHALDISPADLLGKPRGLAVGAEDGEISAIRRSILGLTVTLTEVPTAEDLRTSVTDLWKLYWAGRYAELARELPARIGQARAFTSTDGDTRQAYATLAELLQMTASLLAHLAHEDLAHLALAEADRAAGAAEDVLLRATMAATRSWVLSRQGLWSESEMVALAAADEVEPSMSRASVDQVAVWGELLRYGTTAVARSGRQSEAQELLGLVNTAAARMGSDQPTKYIGAAFGPTVAAMKAVDVAIAADRPRQALKLSERVETPQVAPKAMHARYLLNVGWAQMTDWRSQDAVDTLRQVEQLAPEMMPHQSIARAIVAELLPRRGRQRLPGLVSLADRIGVSAG